MPCSRAHKQVQEPAAVQFSDRQQSQDECAMQGMQHITATAWSLCCPACYAEDTQLWLTMAVKADKHVQTALLVKLVLTRMSCSHTLEQCQSADKSLWELLQLG